MRLAFPLLALFAALLACAESAQAASVCETYYDDGIAISKCYSESEYRNELKRRREAKERIENEKKMQAAKDLMAYKKLLVRQVAEVKPRYLAAANEMGVAADCSLKAGIVTSNLLATIYAGSDGKMLLNEEHLICMNSLIMGYGYIPGVLPNSRKWKSRGSWFLDPKSKDCFWIQKDGSRFVFNETDPCRQRMLKLGHKWKADGVLDDFY